MGSRPYCPCGQRRRTIVIHGEVLFEIRQVCVLVTRRGGCSGDAGALVFAFRVGKGFARANIGIKFILEVKIGFILLAQGSAKASIHLTLDVREVRKGAWPSSPQVPSS